jgi:hypothetical protein
MVLLKRMEGSRDNIHSLTPCSRVLLEKPTGSQLVKKFPAFYRTRRFIITFISHYIEPEGSLSHSQDIITFTSHYHIHKSFYRTRRFIIIFTSHYIEPEGSLSHSQVIITFTSHYHIHKSLSHSQVIITFTSPQPHRSSP